MTFNLEMLQELSDSPYEQLLGKPLPVIAARRYYRSLAQGKVTNQVNWLIDSEKRLREYASLALEQSRLIKINLELDVGLRRGGFNPEQLDGALSFIREHPYLPVSLPKKNFMKAAKERWEALGLPKLNLKDPWYGYPLTAWTKENADEAKQAVLGQYYSTGEKLFDQRKPTGDFEDC